MFLNGSFAKRPHVAHMFSHGWWRLAVVFSISAILFDTAVILRGSLFARYKMTVLHSVLGGTACMLLLLFLGGLISQPQAPDLIKNLALFSFAFAHGNHLN